MTRYLNVSLDTVVRLELPDDHPYFTAGRDGTDEGSEEFVELEMALIEEAQAVIAECYTAEGLTEAHSKVVFSDASVEDVTDEL